MSRPAILAKAARSVDRAARDVEPARRFTIEEHFDPATHSTLLADALRGLTARRKSIPPKYFYDERGSRLFLEICELPEYYLTRAETALLERHAREIVLTARPTDLIELGSGGAHKTRLLLDAAGSAGTRLRYHPVDVCESVLRSSGEELLEGRPWLEVHAIVADYERGFDWLPPGRRRLVAFLGSTIGNYTPRRAAALFKDLARRCRRGDFFLLGADLVKPIERLEAAYDDAAGVTAEFNRNVLHVLNRELDADFRPEEFEHVAFFDARRSWIEMHLRARAPQRVFLRKLGRIVEFRAGETLHTEISRKFTERGLRSALRRAGFGVRGWYAPEDGSFALLLAQRV